MNPRTLCQLAGRLMRCPAAPYHEELVRAEVERLCSAHGLKYELDPFGNVLVRLETAKQRPLVLAAHMDHPAFEIIRPLSNRRWLAQFRAGVADEFFRRGVPLRLMPGATRAKLTKRHPGEKQFELQARATPKTAPRFAVWDVKDFAVRKQKIYGRACDDLIGVATILATLIVLKAGRARVNVIGVISRAEEVGFHGALTVAADRRVPKDSLIISLETSRELPPVKMGQGVIIRVGDRTSIFDSAATRFLTEVATDLRSKQRKFQFQRALMGGGTCEATAYQEFGFQTGAVCVALGNYHNCAGQNKIAAEYVSVKDACGMVDLLVASAKRMPQYARLVSKLPTRLRKMLSEALRNLK